MTGFLRSFPALLCAIAFAVLPVSAQIPEDPPIVCTADNGVPRQVRSEGVSELMGDIVLNCTGGVPTPAGQPIPMADIRVQLDVPLTSRIFADGTAEPLLLIDEPFPANPFPAGEIPIPGSASPQKFCVARSGTNCAVFGTGGTSNPYIGTFNVFQGAITNNNAYLDFIGVPLDPPGRNLERVIRITNLRGDVASVALGNQVQATISVSGNALLALSSPITTVGFVYSGLAPAPNCTFSWGHVVSCPGSATQINVGAMEGFGSSFKTAVITSNDQNSNGGLNSLRSMLGGTVASQNLVGIGINYYTESGMTISASPSPYSGSGIGEANHGTWLMTVLGNIPAGVRITAPGSVQGYSRDGDWPNTPDQPSLMLYRVDVPPSGWQFNPSFYASAPADKVVVDTTGPNPPTTAFIVYEVVTDDPQMQEYLKIPFSVSAQPGVSLAGITKRVMLAPVPEAPVQTGAESTWEQPSTSLDIPRFLDGVPEVSPGLTISGVYALGQTLTAQFTITNPTAGNFTFQQLGLACTNCPAGYPAFQTVSNLTLGPGQPYRYISTQQLNVPGTFLYTVEYQRTDGTWVTSVPSDVPSVTFTVSSLYTLSLNVVGNGTLTANPPPALNGKYAAGSYVCLTATPGSGSKFSYWSGTALDANHCLTLNANASVTATFVMPRVTVTTSVSPFRSGTVTVNPAASGSTYAAGTKVCLTPKPATGYYFVSWSGATLDAQNCLTLNANTSIRATFSMPVTLTLAVSPSSSGSVSAKPSPTHGTYIPGTKVCFTAKATTGYAFASWSSTKLDVNNCLVLTANTTITARFVKAYLLTLKASPSSGGTVTALPASSNRYYASGTKVCLTATPKSGYTFTRWSGATLDSGNCVIVKNTLTITAAFSKIH